MRFVIVTGMSGAGKSTVLKMLEDMGYFCADNLPMPLISKFAEIVSGPSSEYNKVALGVDIRSGQNFDAIYNTINDLKTKSTKCEVLFLDAKDETLIMRFKETRRAHPLSNEGRVDEGIAEERKILNDIKKNADYIIDTSLLLTRELRSQIEEIFVNEKDYKSLFITILSFGFKYGIPVDSDLVFDVRFMPNPYYIEELKKKTGEDKEVREYVMNSEVSVQFMNKLVEMIKFLIPSYIREGKNQLVISIGCTGGKHRSVTVANELYWALSENAEYGIKIAHRDILKH